VVYQVYPRSFFDSDGNGVGDIPGIIERLDHIEALGADVVWVSPFYPSPQADNGYDISDYQGVDPPFGTLADVDHLIAELHTRGMKLVTGTPWLPVNPNFGEINAAAQVEDPDSVFAHYRQLIALRRELPVVVDGDFTLLLPDHPQVFAYTRRLDDDELLVIANLSSQTAEARLPAGWDDSDAVVVSGALDGTPAGHLAPWEARVHRRHS
jgi:glycosidase